MRGEDLKKLRAGLGMTQAQLAGRLGLDVTTLSRWERDAQPIAFPEMLALALGQLGTEKAVSAGVSVKAAKHTRGTGTGGSAPRESARQRRAREALAE